MPQDDLRVFDDDEDLWEARVATCSTLCYIASMDNVL